MKGANISTRGTGGIVSKPVLAPGAAAQNLIREGATWTSGNHGALSNGALTFGFWSSYVDLANSYYTGNGGSILLSEASEENGFLAFTQDQRIMVARAMEQWDELIAIHVVPVASVFDASITFGNTSVDPGVAAYAYLPYGDTGYHDLTSAGFDNAYLLGGDVWVNAAYQVNFEPPHLGSYSSFTLLHEIGHALGLSHPGNYNALDDRDGDGTADPLTYAEDASFYQDSQQYTIMSYFTERQTDASWLDWQTATFVSAMTPMIDDIAAVQALYGADRTTRADATTYGFNATAGNDLFDFDKTPSPVLTIWDAGGRDTLDFSGFSTNEIINLNQGAFSSASAGTTLADLKVSGFVSAKYTQSQLDALFVSYGSGPQGQMRNNIAIAYGTVIENATAGSGDDLLIPNQAANILRGNAGVDTVSYRDSMSGVIASLATNRGTGGDAAGDRYIDIERLEGSEFADHLSGGNRDDVLIGLLGDDVLLGGNGADTLLGGAGNDRLVGGEGADTLIGANGNDLLLGGGGNDRLRGESGNDLLNGGRGDDILNAGTGIDTMTGEEGRDTFVFDVATTTVSITDFQSRYDRIDLHFLDAVPRTSGKDTFIWIADKAFTGRAGELRTYVADGTTFLAGDLDGDRSADLLVSLGHASITSNDLILL